MNEQIWAEVAKRRLKLADFLETLSADEWDMPSLCKGWLVRDVVAHIILESRYSVVRDLPAFTKSRFNFNRFMFKVAKDLGRSSPATLISMVREDSNKRITPIGIRPRYVLADLLVHTQDIRIPLGKEEQIDLGVLRMLFADWQMSRLDLSTYIVGIRKRARRLEFVATDLSWQLGSGKRIEGRMQDVLLALLGRSVVMGRLKGPGLPVLAKRLSR